MLYTIYYLYTVFVCVFYYTILYTPYTMLYTMYYLYTAFMRSIYNYIILLYSIHTINRYPHHFSLHTALQGRAAQTLCQVLSGCPKLIIQLQHTSILSDLLSGGTASGGTAAGTGPSGGTVKYSTPVVVKMLTSLNKMLEDEEVRFYYSIHIV